MWVGSALVAGVLFGPNGIRPGDLTTLALRVPAAGAVIAGMWILMFLPAARVIVRAEPAVYLRSLPGARGKIAGVAIGGLVALQLPWLALWLAGEGARGLGVVAATTAITVGLAAWRARPPRSRRAHWGGPARALAGMYRRGITRRAGHALVRGAGLSVLAGIAGGLLVRNNAVTGREAGVLAAATICVVRVPASVGVLLPLGDAHRTSAWLARSLGISEGARIAVLAGIAALFELAFAAIAVVAACVMLAVNPGAETAGSAPLLWVIAATLPVALAVGLASARVLVWAEPSPSTAARVVIGTVAVVAAAVLWLGTLGMTGVVGLLATALLAIGTVKG